MRDAIFDGETDDGVLAVLISLAIQDIGGRPLYPSPLVEPALYTRFRGWVDDALKEMEAMNRAAKRVEDMIGA